MCIDTPPGLFSWAEPPVGACVAYARVGRGLEEASSSPWLLLRSWIGSSVACAMLGKNKLRDARS